MLDTNPSPFYFLHHPVFNLSPLFVRSASSEALKTSAVGVWCSFWLASLSSCLAALAASFTGLKLANESDVDSTSPSPSVLTKVTVAWPS